MAKTQEKNLKGAKIKTKVFISYSRRNMDWADWLVEQLTDQGIEVLIDRQDIAPGEAWEPRIYSLIDQADTVIFLISSASVNSGICHQEVDYAESLNKRFVPLLLEDPINEKGEKAAVPEALQKINYIFFNRGSDPHKSLKDLVQALLVDIDWVREHTRIGELAQRWEKEGRPSSQLLRGKDLDATETWRDHPQKNMRPPTELQLQYIAACRKGAGKRRNMLVGSLVAGLVLAIGLGGLAFWQRGEAIAEGVRADKELRKSQLSQSKFLNKQSLEMTKSGDAAKGMLLAIEGLPDAQNTNETLKLRPYYPELYYALEYAKGNLFEKSLIQLPESYASLPGVVTKIAISPDGQNLVSVQDFGMVRVWNTNTKKQIQALNEDLINNPPPYIGEDGIGAIGSVKYSTDGSKIAVTGDSIIHLFDAKTLKWLAKLEGHLDDIMEISFSGDGRLLASSSEDKTVIIWDLKTLKKKVVLEGHTDTVNSISFSRDGKLLASGSNDSTIILWDMRTFKNRQVLKDHKAAITSLSFSPTRDVLVSGSFDKTYKVWLFESEKYIMANTTGLGSEVIELAWAPNGLEFSIITNDQTIRLKNFISFKEYTILKGHSDRITNFLYFPDGLSFITASNDKTIRFWNVKNEDLQKLGADSKSRNLVMSFSPDGQKYAFVGNDGKITILDETGKTLFFLNSNISNNIIFSPDSQLLASSSEYLGITLWDLNTKDRIGELKGHDGSVNSISFSPDGNFIASGGEDETIRLWEIKNLKIKAELKGHDGSINSLSFSSDGKFLASGGDDKTIKLWDMKTLKVKTELKGHGESVTRVSFSPNSFQLASGSLDKTVRLWNANNGQIEYVLEGHSEGISSITFSLDGKQLASGQSLGNRSVRLWDTKTGQQQAIYYIRDQFDGSPKGVYDLAYSTFSNHLYASSSYFIYFLSLDDYRILMEKSKNLIYRCLTQKEREDFFLSLEPPRWCITGPDYIRAPRTRWLGKYPYHTKEWKDWLAAKDAGKPIEMPKQ